MSQQGKLAELASLETLTGNTGGPVGPDGLGNINVVGSAPITVAGNPGTNTLTIDTDGTLAITYTEDTGTATAAADNLNVFGDATQGSVTSGAGSTITITNSDATEMQKGVLETSTDAESIAGAATNVAVVPSSLAAKLGSQTANGVAYGAGTAAALSWTSAPTDGQLIIGSTGMAPVAASLTSTGGTVTITPGAGSINLEAAAGGASQFDTDSGSATPAAGVIDILGGTGCATSGATSVVTIDLDAAVPLSFPTDSGTATPATNALTVAGGTNMNTSGASSTVTVNLDTTLTGLTSVTSSTFLGTTFDTNVAAAGVTLSAATLAADGTDTNIDIEITPKGTGVLLTAAIGNAADTTAIAITSAGEVTKPLQPSFLATKTSNQLNVTGNSTVATVNYETEIFDQGGDYDGTNTFTAPVTGRYSLQSSVFITSLGSAVSGRASILTSNRNYKGNFLIPISGQLVGNCVVAQADMDAMDTAVGQGIGSGTGADTANFALSAQNAFFSGALIC